MFELSMWRVELVHPLVVHIPVALLSFAALYSVGALFARSDKAKAHFEHVLKFLVVFGALGAWAAIWSGEQAHSPVNRVICDPTVTDKHEYWSWIAAYLATGAFVATALLRVFPSGRRQRALIALRLLVLLTLGGIVPYTAHLGATLVYQQGAAVYRPSEDCREFSE